MGRRILPLASMMNQGQDASRSNAIPSGIGSRNSSVRRAVARRTNGANGVNGTIDNITQSSAPTPVPRTPAILEVVGITNGLIVKHDADASGNDELYYQYSSDGGQTYTDFRKSPVPVAYPITIPSLSNGTQYLVRIRATNVGGNSGTSTPVSGTPTTNIQTFTDTDNMSAWTAPGIIPVQYLIVAGGGGGGGSHDTGSSGGGAGGMVRTGSVTVIPQVYGIIIGKGGAGGYYQNSGVAGGNSQFGDIVAYGGGGGRASRVQPYGQGGTAAVLSPSFVAATGGYGGGNANSGGAGGGGGAGGAGGNKNGNQGGVGGAGIVSNITGSSIEYGRGGVGANNNGNSNGVNGTNGLGNGGGGAVSANNDQDTGGNGGSGIVVLKY